MRSEEGELDIMIACRRSRALCSDLADGVLGSCSVNSMVRGICSWKMFLAISLNGQRISTFPGDTRKCLDRLSEPIIGVPITAHFSHLWQLGNHIFNLGGLIR